ncbi:MAG TPA: hypothetical protein VLN49_09895 [Gemmatimonadaceae bacterium]|nr:hypothetical protein [Gemmatimonadaceae bacterium]
MNRYPVMRTRILALLAIGAAACRPQQTTAPSPVPTSSAPACPALTQPANGWPVIADTSGFTITLPPRFEERSKGTGARHFDMAPDYEESIIVGTIVGDLGLTAYRRPFQAELMLDYSECTEMIGGDPVSIQAWRTPNGVFRNAQRADRYDVFAIRQVRPGVYLYFTGGTYRASTQALMLASIRSWRRLR